MLSVDSINYFIVIIIILILITTTITTITTVTTITTATTVNLKPNQWYVVVLQHGALVSPQSGTDSSLTTFTIECIEDDYLIAFKTESGSGGNEEKIE